MSRNTGYCCPCAAEGVPCSCKDREFLQKISNLKQQLAEKDKEISRLTEMVRGICRFCEHGKNDSPGLCKECCYGPYTKSVEDNWQLKH